MKLTTSIWQIVKKANRTLFPILLSFVLLASAAGAKTFVHFPNEKADVSEAPKISVEPSATFQRMWIEYNITEGGRKGMRIHTAFKVYDMKGMDGYLALYFQERDGTALQDNNNKFNSAEDTVAVYGEIRPGYQTTVYDDFDVFMPYDELDLPGGNYKLRVDADVIYKEGGLIDHLTFYDFDYNNPKVVAKEPSVTFGRMWADYNITQGGLKGMRIHLKCNVFDMVGQTGYFAFYFQYKDGTPLTTTNTAYRSKDRVGNLSLYYEIAPGYQNTIFEDVTVFIPYDEFTVGRGNHDLKIDVDLIKQDTTLVQHMNFFEFWYERK